MSDANQNRDCYDKILAEHAKLRSLLDAVKDLLFERTAPMSELVNRLTELEALVGNHFQTEENSDCFDNLVHQAPRVSERVEVLIAEHGELTVQVHELVVLAETSSGTSDQWDQINMAFTEFTERLLHHEMVENELMQEVFTEDIGSKD